MNSLPEQFNFAEHLFALNRARGDRIAYIDGQGTLSYSALEDRARRLAAVLAAVQSVVARDIAAQAAAKGLAGPQVGALIHQARVEAVAQWLQPRSDVA